ncbi:MAG: hypothetical protein HKO59_17320 [Phycisphaerales bacterium]|nr:hypothetical protein [Phycisphaerae bacterium]NNF42505.1 hypothetical protein [Phycisphaerales bacterium]NNM27710.1 hypothetical protein [Phycisphaerales bacterium]
MRTDGHHRITLLLALFVPSVHATNVHVFDDPAYVDTVDIDPTAESDNVQATLEQLGYSVTLVEDALTTDWSATLGPARVLIVPEQEVGELLPRLTHESHEAIRAYVASGGGMIVHGATFPRASHLLNELFGWALVESATVSTFTVTEAADGIPFQGGPATLPVNGPTSELDPASLPEGAMSVYEATTGTVAAVLPFGAGTVVFLGWDWSHAWPLGTQDGGWVDVLHRSAKTAGQSCPGDLDGSDDIGVFDMLLVLAAWETSDPTRDLDASGTVDFGDLLTVLDRWGACPSPRNVVILDDKGVVDTANDDLVSSESNNVQATLAQLGHHVQTFGETDPASWNLWTPGVDVVIIPEQEHAALTPDLSVSAETRLRDFVGAGGGLIVHGGVQGRGGDLLNAVFEFTLETMPMTGCCGNLPGGGPTGTLFDGGPGMIPNYNATGSLVTASLPRDSVRVYKSTAGPTSPVVVLPYGAGQIVYLGWDWYDAAPLGGHDGGWREVLDRALLQVIGGE